MHCSVFSFVFVLVLNCVIHPYSHSLSLSLSLVSSCFCLLLVPIDFSQTTRRAGSDLSYEHPMTQPGSACALSFINGSHYQRSAEQTNSDVTAFISFSVLTE